VCQKPPFAVAATGSSKNAHEEAIMEDARPETNDENGKDMLSEKDIEDCFENERRKAGVAKTTIE
jgi:hypothetical protein